MSDATLLIVPVASLRKEANLLRRSIRSLQRSLDDDPENVANIRAQIEKKKGRLSLITEEMIENYQVHWLSLPQHTSRPCPFCFVQGKISNLYPLVEEDGEESAKCEGCKRRFFIPATNAQPSVEPDAPEAASLLASVLGGALVNCTLCINPIGMASAHSASSRSRMAVTSVVFTRSL